MDAPPAVIEPSTSSSSTASVHSTASKVWGVCLVAFDHAVGPTIEYSYPPELSLNEELNKNLPFLALPDGAHTREEDYSYFHLLLPSVASGTLFGISCNRQIQSNELMNKGKDVTRSTVQKAIVVLASKPMFGPLRDKLGVVTRAFFAQKDFDDKGILVDLYSSLELSSEPASGVEEDEDEEESGMYMGTSLRELVYKFRFKTLMLLKLLMLQRKVMFYGTTSPVESLCTFQYSLVALIPALLTHLEDAAAPSLDERSQNTTRPTSLKTSDKGSLLRYLGLPLNIFGKDAFFQPYLPLQQIDLLQARSFLVGTTNSIFQQQRDSPIDVIVNIDTASLEIHDPKLSALLTLTAADRKWMDEIVTTVENSWNAADPSRPLGLNFVGSDDFLRAKFEEYICSLLACIKFGDFLTKGTDGNVLLSSNDIDTSTISSFNEGFINAFKATPAFELWDRTTDSVIFDLVEPRHPMEGKTNAIEDVGIRLAHGLHDLNLDESLGPARDAIARGLTSSSDSIWKTYTSLRTDFTARRTERQSSLTGTSSGHETAPPLLATSVLAGVDVAKTNAVHLASGIGSFLSSKRSQLLGATSTRPTLNSSDTYNHSGGRSFDRSDPPSPTTPSSPSAFSSFFKPYTLAPPPSTTSPSLPSFFTSFVRKSFSDAPYNEETSSPGANQADRDELEEELGPVRDLDLEWAQRQAMLERMRVKEEKRKEEEAERNRVEEEEGEGGEGGEGEEVWEEAPAVEEEKEMEGEKVAEGEKEAVSNE